MNISTSQKNKTKTEIYKVLQLLFTMFHILKSLHNIFIINPTSYNSFNVQNQTIVHPPFDSFISNLLRYLNELLFFFFFFFSFFFFFLSLRLTNFYFSCWALFFPLILNQIGLLLGGFFFICSIYCSEDCGGLGCFLRYYYCIGLGCFLWY